MGEPQYPDNDTAKEGVGTTALRSLASGSKFSWEEVDIVTVYGRPGDGLMDKIGASLSRELRTDALVVSNVYEIPGWEQRLVRDIDGVKLYDMKLGVVR